MTPLQFSCDNEPLTFIGVHVQEIEKYYKVIKLVLCSPVTTYLVHAFYLDLFIRFVVIFCYVMYAMELLKFIDIALFSGCPCYIISLLFLSDC